MRRMLKICYLADATSIHTRRWCDHFTALGHEVHLISFRKADIPGTHVHPVDAGTIAVRGGNWKVLLKYKKIKQLIRTIQPDIVHAMYATSYGVTGALSGFHPYIITPLGTDILISGQQSLVYKRMLRFAFSKADLVTSMAPHMTDAMLKIGVAREKISTVIFGVNTWIFNLSRHKISSDTFVITSTRNLEPVYNIPHFIRAVAGVKDQIPNLRVHITGDGTLRREVEQMVKDVGLQPVTTFYGKVPQEKVAELLGASHIFVTTSLSDGNSLSLIEAMACGAFPIATDIPANREWVQSGENGYFVRVNDVSDLSEKIMKVYRGYDAMLPKALLQNEKIIREKGSWDANMKKMEVQYYQLISSRR